jgi:exosortase A-associated hydrolase 1
MNRRHLTFACEGAELVGTLDGKAGAVGLLIVSGGNEIRSGAFSGQARLAAEIAASGYPVFRFDRRGVGDSEGDNGGFRETASEIAAALAAFREECPQLKRVVALGNCDAASALMLAGGAGCDALVLSNPWTFAGDETSAPPPPDAIRARYAERLKNPREVWRLISGGVNLRKLARGIGAALRRGRFTGSYSIALAGRDRTAQAFAACWGSNAPHLRHRPGADHAFSSPEDTEWLRAEILAALHKQALLHE